MKLLPNKSMTKLSYRLLNVSLRGLYSERETKSVKQTGWVPNERDPKC